MVLNTSRTKATLRTATFGIVRNKFNRAVLGHCLSYLTYQAKLEGQPSGRRVVLV